MRPIKTIFTLLIILSISMAFLVKSKSRILIIGDSISIGYTPFVQEDLKDIADVVHNPGNAEHTGTGLKNIDKWIGDGHWDIIQFNWGLWDLCYRSPDSKVQGNRDKVHGKLTWTLDEYAANLDSLVTLIQKKSDAKLIFVTTTFVPEQEAGRFSEDAIRYNAVAKKIMKKHGVVINDLYRRSKSIHDKYGLGPDNVHYTKEGYRELGKVVAGFLKKELRESIKSKSQKTNSK
jgi:hypothetical protein